MRQDLQEVLGGGRSTPRSRNCSRNTSRRNAVTGSPASRARGSSSASRNTPRGSKRSWATKPARRDFRSRRWKRSPSSPTASPSRGPRSNRCAAWPWTASCRRWSSAGLIEQIGRAEVVGRPMTYGTTELFLQYFGLGSLDDMPAADELRRIPVTKPEALLTVDAGLATAPPEQLRLGDNVGPAPALRTATNETARQRGTRRASSDPPAAPKRSRRPTTCRESARLDAAEAATETGTEPAPRADCRSGGRALRAGTSGAAGPIPAAITEPEPLVTHDHRRPSQSHRHGSIPRSSGC